MVVKFFNQQSLKIIEEKLLLIKLLSFLNLKVIKFLIITERLFLQIYAKYVKARKTKFIVGVTADYV